MFFFFFLHLNRSTKIYLLNPNLMKGKNFVLCVLFYFLGINMYAQKYSLSGKILDAENGESCIGVSVYILNSLVGVATNSYGFYSLELEKGNYEIVFSSLGYITDTVRLNVTGNQILNKSLTPISFSLSQINIGAGKNIHVQRTELSLQEVTVKELKRVPVVMGESDVLKVLQYLPGVQTVSEGTANISVRGGSHDQNLILLDGAPVYNPSHALGFFSTFNPDALKNIKLYTGVFPAEYGGRISSVVDVQMKEGNNQEIKLTGGVGLIASRLTIESPIIKDTASLLISGRYSYAGQTLKLVEGTGVFQNQVGYYEKNNNINFYDLNVKANYKINKKNHLFLSAYTGRDHFYYYLVNTGSTLNWGNLTSTLRWNHTYGSKMFSNLLLMYSDYDYAYTEMDDIRNFEWSSNMNEIDLKYDVDYFANNKNHLKYGFSIENHFYSPGKVEPRTEYSVTKPLKLDDKRSAILAVYLGNQYELTKKIKLDYSLRYSFFAQLGKGVEYNYNDSFKLVDSIFYASGKIMETYGGFEPRFSIRYLINDNQSIKMSYSINRQYQQLISNSSLGLPTDIWLPCDKFIEPIASQQYVTGFYDDNLWLFNAFSVEMYFKESLNIIDYKDNADLMLNPNIETEILKGKSKAYGIELLFKKDMGNFTGWLSYTLSKVNYLVKGINNDKAYPARFDKPHNMSLVLMYALNRQWDISGTFKFTSGGTTTVPNGTFYYYGSTFSYFTERNGYRLPNYHRLDLSVIFKSKKSIYRKLKSEWSFGIYNVYNRHNVFSIYVKQINGSFNESKAYKMYLYGFVPFVNYNFKF